jgi:hypothetical protein
MRCVFCKCNTTEAEPLEHILPEGIGNTEHVLKRGVVCGKCNNYFARKIEKPFLELPAVLALRFQQAVPSKRGLAPPHPGFLMDGLIPVEANREPHDWETSISVPDEAVRRIMRRGRGKLILPAIPTSLEPTSIVSRFLGKVGMEAFAHRLEHDDELLSQMVEEQAFDPLRSYVRQGITMDWPISIRRIYDAQSQWVGEVHSPYQIMHEFDFLVLDSREIYFVLALFGQELVMNMGGPSLEGWETWLAQNDNVSPLQHGKNAGCETRL